MGDYRIAFSGLLGNGLSTLVTGITDLEILTGPDGPLLVSTTRAGGGMAVFDAGDGALLHTIAIPQALLQLTPPEMAMIHSGGQSYLATLGLRDTAIQARLITAEGAIGPPVALTATAQDLGRITNLVEAQFGGMTFHYASLRGTGLLRLESGSGAQLAAQPVPLGGAGAQHGISDLVRVTVAGRDYIVTSFATADSIAAFRVNAGGALQRMSEYGAAQGLGIDAPSALRAVEVAGQSYVILASPLSSSLSVFEVQAGGILRPVDHVIDDLGTRFQNVTALETITVAGRSFVLAGGSDDGVTLLTLLPGGRLVHLDSFADTQASSLANVGTLAAVQIGQTLRIFASGERKPGITQLSVNIADIGVTLAGTSGNDSLTGGAGDDILAGGHGNDTLIGGAGNDILYDGAGMDRLTGGPGADLFVLAADGEHDVITDFEPGIDRLDLSAFTGLTSFAQIQVLSQPWGAELRYGNEVIELRSASGGSFSRADLSAGDFLNLTRLPTGSLSPAADGDPAPPPPAPPPPAPPPGLILSGGAGNDSLTGGPGNDTLYGGLGHDTLSGGAGDDLLYGDRGNDFLYGGNGRDQLFGGDGNDVLDGGIGWDILYGGEGRDILYGGAGLDTLIGGGGNDTLYGGADQDTLIGGPGADFMDGGDGSDVYFVDGDDTIHDSGTVGYDRAQINDPAGIALNRLAQWSGVDRVNGFTGNDTLDASGSTQGWFLFGHDGDDLLRGGAGSDTLLGGDGDDVIHGGDGNDILQGGRGNDTFYGGAGDDLIYVGESGDFIADAGPGFDRVLINNPDGLHIAVGAWQGVERIVGYIGDDLIDATGATLGMIFALNDGDDTLIGGEGDDTVYAGLGDDLVFGGAGDDALIGGPGDDTLVGGAGDDFLLGGAGADVFVFGAGFGRDVIRDFTRGEDRMDFTGHSAVNALGDLIIAQAGAHTVITLAADGHQAEQITLTDFIAATLTEEDFGFV